MNKQGILHIPDSKYCFPLDEKTLVLRLRLAKEDSVKKVEVIYESKYKIQQGQKCLEMERKYEDALFAWYEVTLVLSDVRLAYVFRIWEGERGFYFSEDGLTVQYDFSLAYFNFFQMPYINRADVHEEVPWMKDAVFYEIFVERFLRGKEKKEDSYINLPWGEKPSPKSFAGGDIPGITKKLDYIKGLQADVLYLTPVFQSVSNHKYDISDYHVIDEQFGTNADFDRLVKEAHKRGMRIVLDAVFNHCSENLPQFQDVKKKGRRSPYFDWFVILGDAPCKEPLNYEVFAFCDYMPKFNTSNPQVQEFLINIAVSWIRKYDIDGWRLDVSDEVSHDFWRLFRKKVKEVKPDCVIIGENWHDANTFLQGDQYDGIMNYAFTKACLDYYALGNFGAKEFAWKLNALLMRNTGQVNRMMLNLLDSHDTDRFYTSVGKNKDKVLSALAVMCMFVGVPCIYYGTEILLEGGYDPDNRGCFDWNEEHWDRDFMNYVKELLGMRKESCVAAGEIRITVQDELLCIKRFDKEQEITLWANESGKEVSVQVNGEMVMANRYQDRELLTDGFLIFRSLRL
ncbi:MAG: glycoside hydrolase family 13 protein [Lachnospiraceae bacterium]|nr:glycoside hydrolase family 13 protein [Lachnospiraceae bacterium]